MNGQLSRTVVFTTVSHDNLVFTTVSHDNPLDFSHNDTSVISHIQAASQAIQITSPQVGIIQTGTAREGVC